MTYKLLSRWRNPEPRDRDTQNPEKEQAFLPPLIGHRASILQLRHDDRVRVSHNTGTSGILRGAPGREAVECASASVVETGARERKLFAIVLAAGLASRFGSAKQLAEYESAPLVTRVVRLGVSVCGSRTVLVVGHEWLRVVAACSPLAGFFVNNSGYRTGMGGSIACGVRSVAGVADAILLLLADQPLITKSHLDRLIASRTSTDSVVATAFAGTVGPPVLFPRRYFGELSELEGDAGARQILARTDSLEIVEFEDAAVDIDRPEDFL